MELVIKLDDKIYQEMIEDKKGGYKRELLSAVTEDFPLEIADAIIGGTPLPKGHGRLIDADKLDTRERGNNSQRTMWWNIDCIVKDAPTIIEADK